ncbi:transcriptional regulator [Cellvibrio zantedeschiae]|uniref:Transcriptional regulator n=1 Tax=Cellvibrio zantedeschiae TaxID=1237077 RepID=A0ABQ3AVG0_9GAMM|nr:LacI family DNA-binding transcriptional regulator [Cellvibrio zantedeschiae]GGY67581.1 transcriptional regulator [Cellvibrio zantedeschiae]
MNHPKSTITIHDIAAAAEVSISTVSLVLRDSPLVAKKTREKILAVIENLGYVYNRSAASMRSQRSGVIAMSINDLANPYFSGLTSSMERALNELDRTVLLSDVREDVVRQTRFIEKMREHNVDGLLICPAHATDAKQLMTQLKRANLPCVLVSRNLPGSGLDYAGYDHRAGMRLAVEHLIELGHTRIALLGGSRKTWVGGQRLEGYRQALKKHGIKRDATLEIEGPLNRSVGVNMIEHALALPNPPTAAACANDAIAFGVMLGLRRHGLEAGRDFSITGNDDVAECTLWEPALTTVASNVDLIGERAAELLLARIDNPDQPAQHINLPLHLVVRGSTCPPLK